MLIDAIGNLLPSALAVALSPIPIVAVILVLGSLRARTAGPAFALGWVAGLSAVSAVVVLVLGGGGHDQATGVAWVKVALGILLLVMAARQWRKRPRKGDEAEPPRWMAGIASVSAPRAAGMGVALSAANPKNLVLTLAASASIAQAGLDGVDEAIAIAVFVALGSVTVAGAVLFYLLDSGGAERPLAAMKQFMSDNNAVIMMIVLLVIGAKLIGDGLAGTS